MSLSEIIQESLLLLGDRYEKKNVRLVVEIPENIWVIAEKRSLINTVINNLLTNALIFLKIPVAPVLITKSEPDLVCL